MPFLTINYLSRNSLKNKKAFNTLGVNLLILFVNLLEDIRNTRNLKDVILDG